MENDTNKIGLSVRELEQLLCAQCLEDYRRLREMRVRDDDERSKRADEELRKLQSEAEEKRLRQDD